MPDVFFIGEIHFVEVNGLEVSVTYSVVPGNAEWNLKSGAPFGETMTSLISQIEGRGVLNHPLSIHYEVSTSEGWPCLVAEARIVE